MKGKVYVLILVMLSFVGLAQDNHYSQFYANKLYLNPAFAGTEVCPRIILGFRDQWPGLSGEYVSYTASYDQSFNNVGFGLIFNGDDAGRGILKTNNVSAVISPKVKINGMWTLSFAVEAGVVQKRLDHSSLEFPNQINSYGSIPGVDQEITNDRNVIKSDINTGILLYSKFMYMGYSMHHVLEPNISLIEGDVSELYRRHTGHIGMNIELPAPPKEKRLGRGPKIAPQIIFQQQGPAREVNLGVYYTKNKFTTGMWYRNEDALAVLFGVQTRKFNFGFSYDITTSKLANNSLGALELSTSYKFNCLQKRKSPPRIDCPSF